VAVVSRFWAQFVIGAAVTAFILLFIGCIVFGVWARFYAPCSAIGWLPLHEMPGRCLTLVRP